MENTEVATRLIKVANKIAAKTINITWATCDEVGEKPTSGKIEIPDGLTAKRIAGILAYKTSSGEEGMTGTINKSSGDSKKGSAVGTFGDRGHVFVLVWKADGDKKQLKEKALKLCRKESTPASVRMEPKLDSGSSIDGHPTSLYVSFNNQKELKELQNALTGVASKFGLNVYVPYGNQLEIEDKNTTNGKIDYKAIKAVARICKKLGIKVRRDLLLTPEEFRAKLGLK